MRSNTFTEVTVYPGNLVANKTVMNVAEIAAKFWASKWSDAEQYPWPIERSFGMFLASPPEEEGVGITIATDDGVSQLELLDAVLDLEPK